VPPSGARNPVMILITSTCRRVVDEEADDLVVPDHEADVLERSYVVERLRDAIELEQVRRRRLHGRVAEFRRERRRTWRAAALVAKRRVGTSAT
jgi:hypothetical protein